MFSKDDSFALPNMALDGVYFDHEQNFSGFDFLDKKKQRIVKNIPGNTQTLSKQINTE